MKQVLRIILCAIFIIGLGVYLLATALIDLTNKEDVQTIRLDAAAEVIEVEHSINGLIPMGKDYFYAGFDDEKDEAYIIKAPKKWLEKNFDSEGYALSTGGMEITALTKRISDFELEKELNSTFSQIDDLYFPLGYTTYIDTAYKTTIIAKLVLFVLYIFIVAAGIFILKKGMQTTFSKIWVVVIMAWLIALLIVIN